jgi:hypothetical protein
MVFLEPKIRRFSARKLLFLAFSVVLWQITWRSAREPGHIAATQKFSEDRSISLKRPEILPVSTSDRPERNMPKIRLGRQSNHFKNSPHHSGKF